MSSYFNTTIYTHLITLLLPQPPTVLEIEILPSTISQTILHTGHCIGVPKPLLILCFLRARTILFSHLTNTPDQHGVIPTQKEALNATLVILLFDAGHVSALNLRKRSLWAVRTTALALPFDDGNDKINQSNRQDLVSVVQRELTCIESFVTSPLYKHAKSSTLWAHRWWIVKWFLQDLAGAMIDSGDYVDVQGEEGGLITFVGKELKIVMRAGEGHAGNYHAWNYARETVRLVMLLPPTDSERLHEGPAHMRRIGEAWRCWVQVVHQWCLGHPRDISGWSFLLFLMEQPPRHAENREVIMRDVLQKTNKFVERLGWQGQSVDWFLASATHLQMDPNR
ncbi:MAG: hypothetical protein LQ346_002132 [Caloplaca aetnensis]|nr:MAG: hypothetical protein LQ346_002132 [Caloplaca aetnensis]